MSSRTSNQHILVIDDNRSIHEDFRKILSIQPTGASQLDDFEATFFGGTIQDEESPGFEIDSAFQGQDGLDLVRQSLQENRPYPVAFVDMRMPPGWDGIETIARIWKEYPDLQVVICTAYSDYSWDEMVKRLGNTDQLVLLRKPFDNAEVLELAKKLTEKWHQSQEAKEKSDPPDES
jgi:CheY-like chemotaxis protein